MQKLDYGTLLSPEPITLSLSGLNITEQFVINVKKPTLRDVAKLGFDTFNLYESFLKISPRDYYKISDRLDEWDNLDQNERESTTLFEIIQKEETLQQFYCTLLSFFIDANVYFQLGVFFISEKDLSNIDVNDIKSEDVMGIINESIFNEILKILQQICSIYTDETESKEAEPVFKNDIARELYYKMQKAEEERKLKREGNVNKNLTLPNIISAVSNRHPNLNPVSVWDLTVYQLFDTFNRLQMNDIYSIDSTRVSVWGDKENTFNSTLWYKNNFDK